MIITLPDNVQKIINELSDHGYAAYAVGGCVRDVLIGRIPGDWDITTSATPLQVKNIFRRTVDTGIAHGTVTVLMGDETYEVTTFRVDGKYSDARHPESVTFVPNLSEDLLRRDFTINAMAYSDAEGIIDLYGGMEDLRNGIIRCVGVSEERFGEDALRMMRAVRFASQLGFEIEDKTLKAIETLHSTISKVSAERIQVELVKLDMSDHPEKWEMARQTGLAEMILPELEKQGTQIGYDIIKKLPKDKGIRLSAMLYTLSYDETSNIMRRLKFDNATTHLVKALVGLKCEELPKDEAALRILLNRVGDEVLDKSLTLKKAFGEGTALSQQVDEVRKMYEVIRSRGDCTDMKSLAVNGADLKAMGIETGPVIGKILNSLLREVLIEPSKNNREYLMSRINQQDFQCKSNT